VKIILKHIASIQTGIYGQTVSSGSVVYLKAKHFDESGNLYNTVIPDLPLNSQTEKHLLNDGDIIFAAKGSKNFAALFESKNGQCVASSTFLVIRLNDEFRSGILSEYIVWFINHPGTQEWLKAKARGSSIPSISKIDLQELEIVIPPIEKQKAIVIIDSLQKKEWSIIKRIQSLKEKYIQHRLISAINK
jgi:restriction endonuclease S subunit